MRRRFFIEKFDAGRAVIEGETAHHMGRVLRAQTGQLFELSDGRKAWLARIEKVGRERIEFSLLEQLDTNPPSVKTSLFLAVVKFDAFEWALEKATELGVCAIVPLATERSEKSLLTAAPKRAERWLKILTSAAEQSRRLSVPALHELLKPAVAFGSTDADIRLLLSERPGATSLRSVLVGVPAKSVAIAIGPEGGWTDGELSAAEAAGFHAVSMGSLILRSETAVIAALANVNYAWG